MATFGQHPSQQDAKVQNQHNVTAGTKRPSAGRRWRNPLDDDLSDLFSIPNWGGIL